MHETASFALPQVAILVVDDRPENLLALEAVLEPLGQRVVRAPSGAAALAAVEAEQFAVILMDIRMPGLDGFQTTALLKQRESSSHTPIIFLSAAPDEQDDLRSYSSGAVDYLQKPFEPDALRSKVSVFVRLRQNELALERSRAELEATVARRTAELAEANRKLALEVEERRAAEHRLYERAFRDDLTSLANRALFGIHLRRAMARAKRHKSSFAVLLVDLDRFKVVNDSLGHACGDALLVGVAQRLVGALREEDTVARLGGDEFAILLEDTVTVAEAVKLAERLGHRLAVPFDIEGKEVFPSASIGVAMMSARHESGEDLLREADAAMYRAKEAGGGHYVFDAEMREGLREQLHLEADLRRAVEREEFVLHYQPIVNLGTGVVDGVEALIRWKHPSRGLLSPGNFIPLSEDTGLIRTIGTWALREACRQLVSWRDEGISGLGMSVNISARQFSDPRLLDDIRNAAADSGADLEALTLELTEGAVMPKRRGAEATLSELRDLGVGISLDDFGTGHSCLGYLHRFPVTTLKIDRSFVSRIGTEADDGAIVQTITSLAHSLKLSIVAEGVETSQQLNRLRALKCQRGQGYLFAKPLHPRDVAGLMSTGLAWRERLALA